MLVTFDRITATDPNYQKSYLLHSWGRPETEGADTVVEGSLNAGIMTADPAADLITMDLTGLDSSLGYDTMTRTGRLFSRILLPARHVITKIGGHTGDPYGADDYEFYVDGANRTGTRDPADNPDNQYYDLGQWLAEISPETQQLTDNFLVVMYPRDIWTDAGDLPTTQLIEAVSDGLYGVQVGEQIALFSITGDPLMNFAYVVDPGMLTEHLLVDLLPGQLYRLTNGGDVWEQTATSEGTLFFDDMLTGMHMVSVEFVPEPATVTLLVMGVAMLLRRRRRRSSTS